MVRRGGKKGLGLLGGGSRLIKARRKQKEKTKKKLTMNRERGLLGYLLRRPTPVPDEQRKNKKSGKMGARMDGGLNSPQEWLQLQFVQLWYFAGGGHLSKKRKYQTKSEKKRT